MLVQEKESDDYTVSGPETKRAYLTARIRANFDHLPLYLYPRRNVSLFSSSILPDGLKGKIEVIAPDVVHMHWVTYGFLRPQTLTTIKRPIVWTLHDMWPFTGGCHYSQGCERYVTDCGCCPLLSSSSPHDLSWWNWQWKAESWRGLPLTIVSPSRWLADCAKRSQLFKDANIEVIPNGIDLTHFSPRDKALCRDILSLPQGKKIILTGGIDYKSDGRKGFDLLLPAVRQLKEVVPNAALAVVGMTRPETIPDFGLPVYYLGRLNDEISLGIAYGAADLFVAPSRKENLSNMVLEAISCGIPCVAYAIGGMPDLIENGSNGFLSPPFDTTDLAAGMIKILNDDSLRHVMGKYSRQKEEHGFAMDLVAGRYSRLYEKAICMYKARVS